MLEEDVHGLPQRVIQDLDHFLMHERIVGRGAATNTNPGRPASAKVMAPRAAAASERSLDFRIAFRRAEAHHDIFGLNRSPRARGRRGWTDRAPAARACRRSPDERIPPRRAARRWRKVRVRTPAGGRPRGSAPTSPAGDGQPHALRARRIPRRAGCGPSSAFFDMSSRVWMAVSV